MYQIERQDQLYKTLPLAPFFSPIIVVFSAFTLIPLSGVFAPGSLTVTTKTSTDIRSSCWIPTGNISTPNTIDSTSLFTADGWSFWTDVTSRATDLTTQCLVE